MTREEAKQMLPIIQAYAEGKEIQFKLEDKWINTKNPDLEFGVGTYRIKPEPKYRPFKNAEECWNEMLKHQPFGWVKIVGDEMFKVVHEINDEGIIWGDDAHNYTGMYDICDFADGELFGIKEEE